MAKLLFVCFGEVLDGCAHQRAVYDLPAPCHVSMAQQLALQRLKQGSDAIESVNERLRKIIKTRGHFPSDDAATKLIWLALRNITADWGRAAKEWREAMNQFAILYEERFTAAHAGR